MKIIEPGDEVMADRGFKVREDLLAVNADLVRPPSCAKDIQMLMPNVRLTNRIANSRTYVENVS